jgi:hypothetical protein
LPDLLNDYWDSDDEFIVHGGFSENPPDTQSSDQEQGPLGAGLPPTEGPELAAEPAADPQHNQDADGEEAEPRRSNHSTRRRKNKNKNIVSKAVGTSASDFLLWSSGVAELPSYVAAALKESQIFDQDPHMDLISKDALQQLASEEGKKIVPVSEVRSSKGKELERWKLSAEEEHSRNFVGMGAMHDSTPQELREYGKRALPMLLVWSKDPSRDKYKCRACVCVGISLI